VTDVDFVANAAYRQPVRAGLAAIKKLLKDHNVDAVLTREIGEIAFHTLRDHQVDIYGVPNATVRDAVAAFANQSLPLMRSPTHPSEAAGAPADADIG
jgi:predicted Fe-Mo cluster-binding NifX family protein